MEPVFITTFIHTYVVYIFNMYYIFIDWKLIPEQQFMHVLAFVSTLSSTVLVKTHIFILWTTVTGRLLHVARCSALYWLKMSECLQEQFMDTL